MTQRLKQLCLGEENKKKKLLISRQEGLLVTLTIIKLPMSS